MKRMCMVGRPHSECMGSMDGWSWKVIDETVPVKEM